jgi:hypothetical protein
MPEGAPCKAFLEESGVAHGGRVSRRSPATSETCCWFCSSEETDIYPVLSIREERTRRRGVRPRRPPYVRQPRPTWRPIYMHDRISALHHPLQEWRAAPTAVAYADGQMSGPSAYVRSRAAAQRAPRRRHPLGVEKDTPTATLGVPKAVGVARASAPIPLRP